METTASPVENKSPPLPALLIKLAWGIIVFLLVFLPFQKPICKALKFPGQFLWIDEFFVASAFILFLFIFVYQGKIRREAGQILFCLITLGMVGIISGFI